MSKILDPWTRDYLRALGVGAGWRCLELGGGNGSITEWLCDTVGAAGSVTAYDINPALLQLIPASNLTVQAMDVRIGQLPAGAYDLVTCRALLHQIAEYAPAVLAQMTAALKPGGRLPAMVSALGLEQPRAKTDVQNIRGTDRGAIYFKLFFAEVRERVLAAGAVDAATLDAATALLDDPTYWTQCWMMTAVWARKPPATTYA